MKPDIFQAINLKTMIMNKQILLYFVYIGYQPFFNIKGRDE
jgi:hypothetical protein